MKKLKITNRSVYVGDGISIREYKGGQVVMSSEDIIVEGPVVYMEEGILLDDRGNDGDLYINTLTWDLYQKENGSWF